MYATETKGVDIHYIIVFVYHCILLFFMHCASSAIITPIHYMDIFHFITFLKYLLIGWTLSRWVAGTTVLLYLHYATIILILPIHCPAFSLFCLVCLHYCNEKIF